MPKSEDSKAGQGAARKKTTKKRSSAGSSGSNGSNRSLVIVESPAKARTIERYLGKDFKVMASVGHVVDLPVSKLGVDVDHDFEPQYEVIKGKKKIIDELKREAKKSRRVYLAPDPDREGEAIAYHIAEKIGDGTEVHRAVFHEITAEAVRRAIDHPTDINRNLFNAQQARRILDRLVGYKISPLLWKRVKYGLSAGRVQSVAMRLICDREREVQAFVPEEYWTIGATAHASSPPPFHLRLDKIDGKKASIPNVEASNRIVGECRNQRFVVGNVIKKEVAKKPFPPFITSTLQQEASRRLRYTSRRTMSIAQRLYEGVDLGDRGSTGLITYMRTDSTRLSNTALEMIRGYINKSFDKDYLPASARFWGKVKGAQEAHEAIRPTDINITPEIASRYLEKDQLALYSLIWTRTIASQMADAKLERTRIEVPVGNYLFIATGSVVAFSGFMKIYEEARDEEGKSESDSEGEEPVANTGDEQLPPVKEGDELRIEDLKGDQHFTQPPPRYTEAGLIKELEKQGIGRPSTYASIISTIQDREYAEREKGHFKPTEIGFIVTDMLSENFPQIMDIKFTAKMENQLDQVEEGDVNWIELLKEFYDPFEETLKVASEHMRNLKQEVQETDIECDRCGAPMVVRWGRNGKFLACSAYPDCRNTKPVAIDEQGKIAVLEDEVTDYSCENCGKAMVIKSGRRGRFLACSGYPECKTSRPIPIGVNCPRPGCPGELVERMSGRGTTFYSCNQYPDCRYIIGALPQPTQCEACGKERLVAGKGAKAKVFGCLREDCPYLPAWDEEDYEKKRRASEKRAATKSKAATKKKAPKKKAAKKKKAATKKAAAARKTTAKKTDGDES